VKQRGVTVVEVVLVTALLALLAAAGVWLSGAAQAYGMRSATTQFDSILAYAQALAAAGGNGATLVFDRRSGAQQSALPGFVLTVYAGRPTTAGAMQQAAVPPLISTAEVQEARLGAVPFTVFLNSAGHASAMTGAVTPEAVVASDPGCPPGESSVVLTFADPRAADARSIPCDRAISGAPISISTVAP
jgi:hypothetical protein